MLSALKFTPEHIMFLVRIDASACYGSLVFLPPLLYTLSLRCICVSFVVLKTHYEHSDFCSENWSMLIVLL